MARIHQAGVTLIEMAVAMVILGILAGLALPSFSSYLAGVKARAVADNFIAGLQTARMEALKRNESTVFLLLVNTNDALDNNWMVNLKSVDPVNSISTGANSNTVCPNASTAVSSVIPTYQIQKSCGENGGVTVATNLSPSNWVTFNALGQASTAVASPQIDMCAANTTQKYSVRIYPGGQLKMCDWSITSTTDMRYCDANFSVSGC